ncbi:MAG TPA: triose-phosphate isomerase, partial [Candidatus Cloacimonadota bacterium]|nr:triose-phosphate isomerase [Candidatus Cloacimonadota bacterium]
SMLSSLEMQFCIIGHSERRQYHQESDTGVRDKQLILREYGIKPILCIGETLAQRDAGETSAVLISQLEGCFKDVPLESGEEVIVAYEPVWAIGTGRTASPAQAQEAHALIRNWFEENYNPEIAAAIHILYGGSVKPDNIVELLSCPDIDGGLIGGAALKLESYVQMVQSATKLIQSR